MTNGHSPLIQRGVFELYAGCMRSGKSKRLIEQIDKLSYLPSCKIITFKPGIDTRSKSIISRFGSLSLNSTLIDEKNPKEILNKITPEIDVVAIDEINLFSKEIVAVIERLIKDKKYVIGAGLDTDFRGEPFGEMPKLLSIATFVRKLIGVCQYPGCSSIATRTQRLINKKPAHYTSPLVMIEGETAEYECRCINHHEVPGKPKTT